MKTIMEIKVKVVFCKQVFKKERENDHGYNVNGIVFSAANCSKSVTNKEELNLVETEKSDQTEI